MRYLDESSNKSFAFLACSTKRQRVALEQKLTAVFRFHFVFRVHPFIDVSRAVTSVILSCSGNNNIFNVFAGKKKEASSMSALLRLVYCYISIISILSAGSSVLNSTFSYFSSTTSPFTERSWVRETTGVLLPQSCYLKTNSIFNYRQLLEEFVVDFDKPLVWKAISG